MESVEFTFGDVAAAVSESQQIARRDLLDAIKAEIAAAKSDETKRALARVWSKHLRETK